MQLDRNQEKAVNHVTGPAIVIAGPGSGKTTVVTARILNLIQTHNIPPSQILAIAFNRKAVEEMETRILQALTASETETAEKPVIRTLHAFGKDIITENYERAGFSQIPEIWSGEIDRLIAEERRQIERAAATTEVAIYKIENRETGKCYIGQTTNPERREKEHFDHSSNDRLRQAIRFLKERRSSVLRSLNVCRDERRIVGRHTGSHTTETERVCSTAETRYG